MIVGRFSDFAKMRPPQFEAVDVREIVRAVVKLNEARFRAEGKPQIECVTELPEEPVRISADPDQLRRVASNHVLKGIGAKRGGGRFSVTGEAEEKGAGIEVPGLSRGVEGAAVRPRCPPVHANHLQTSWS